MKKLIVCIIGFLCTVSLLWGCNDEKSTIVEVEPQQQTEQTEQVKIETEPKEVPTEPVKIETQHVEPEHPKKLREECDMVLCTGRTGQDYYELVANQIDSYPDSTFEFGVIKNNEWLVEMSPNCPFIDESGWWKGLDKKYDLNTVSEENFKHIGGGPLFLYRLGDIGGSVIIYNPETNVSFENLCNRDYEKVRNHTEFIGMDHWYVGTSHYVYLKYFNTETGEARELGGYFEDADFPNEIKDISCGLFYAKAKRYEGFFDINGTMVLDLSEYSITHYHGYKFKDGTYTITCTNNSGVKYDITFDISGNIIKQSATE